MCRIQPGHEPQGRDIAPSLTMTAGDVSHPAGPPMAQVLQPLQISRKTWMIRPQQPLRPAPGGSPVQVRRISEPGRRIIRPPSPAERMTRRVTRPKPASFRVWSRIIRSHTTSDPTSERIIRPRPSKIKHLRGGSSAPAERRASQRPDHPAKDAVGGRVFAGDPPDEGREGFGGRVIRVLWGNHTHLRHSKQPGSCRIDSDIDGPTRKRTRRWYRPSCPPRSEC